MTQRILLIPILTLILLLLPLSTAHAQKGLDYYLPQDVAYNADIPVPQSVFGYEVGEWHVRHDLLREYMEAVAAASDRVTITEFGRTYEGRKLVMLTITSPRNQANIEQIREQHLQLTDPARSGELNVDEMPAVVWLGYSVHGNEPSGSNAAPLSAYYYAAAQGPEIEELLENTVILLDPSVNPDGLDRFASWANTNKSFNQNTDPNTREHRENWPGSRTNHYWFDLNRDWMPIQHPSSRGRIAMYNHWMPNVLTDHHEMGTQATYFFQPGIPARNNPLTPERNFELTAKLAEYHAEFLNEIGSLYYTKESFDDFYPGKGSTYPDLRGTIGILFEQASSRGHLQDSQHGEVCFPFTIRNQFLTSLSTVKGTFDLRTEFNTFMRDFYRTAIDEARRSAIKGYVFGDTHDPARVYHMLDILHGHQIEVYKLDREVTIDGQRFGSGEAWVVPTEQPQYRFLTSLFEKRTTFTDSLFYDISTWTLPLAFNIPYAELRGRAWNSNLLGEKLDQPTFPSAIFYNITDPYAFVFEWDGYYAPRALNRLLEKNVRVKVAARPFAAATVNGRRDFTYGTIMVATGIQDRIGRVELNRIMQTIADEDAIDVYALETGLSLDGIDLGSPNFNTLRKPEMMVVVGSGVSAGEAGEIWHQYDQRYNIPVSMVDIDVFNSADLDRYNTIVMVNGNYNRIGSGTIERLRRWVSSGGTLIAQKSAARWAVNNNLAKASFNGSGDDDNDNGDQSATPKPYIDAALNRGAQVIGGSIFEARLDLTHPLSYGYRRQLMSVFRNSTLIMESPTSPYAAPLRYTSSPLLSGYISSQNLDRLRDSSGIVVSGTGSGRTILMTDNPHFRAFWFGTNKLFANAVFFGHTISGITREQ
ncbi:MAG: zinc carboxypeptidase [Balneolaceae bacterium]|nr:MAG: zinc carboxypeptidase [Balneolaceae bacterium]